MKIKWLSVIRVIGLVFVLLYHFFIKYFPGGFVGLTSSLPCLDI